MIIRTELLQESCAQILNAVDSNVLSAITETLEIEAHNKMLRMAVTNREYFVDIHFGIESDEEIHATINANLFLKLISKVTSETIELLVVDNSLLVKCNGDYKLPLIYEGAELLSIPRIDIENVTEEFDVESNILRSLVHYNSKELNKGTISKPIQKMYYIDNKGAITFTSGACVNGFDIDMKSRVLLNDKLVKLFKLFKDDKVKMTIGHNQLSKDVIATVVSFETPEIYISSVLSCDDTMLVNYPVDAIRGRATAVYKYGVPVNKSILMQAIERLTLFNAESSIDEYKTIIKMIFGSESVTISDRMGINQEEIPYNSNSPLVEDEYVAFIDSSDLSKTLASCTNQFVNINFGNSQAFVLSEGNIRWVIPECQES